jgi:hypothetical protein
MGGVEPASNSPFRPPPGNGFPWASTRMATGGSSLCPMTRSIPGAKGGGREGTAIRTSGVASNDGDRIEARRRGALGGNRRPPGPGIGQGERDAAKQLSVWRPIRSQPRPLVSKSTRMAMRLSWKSGRRRPA